MGDEPEAPRVEWKDGPAEPGPRVYTVTELPLNVRVAEAIGWSHFEQSGRLDRPWKGYPPKAPIVGSKEMVPDFPEDWAATGPLIHQFKLRILPMWDEYGSRDWRWQVTPFASHLGAKKEGFGRFGDGFSIEQLMPHAERSETEAAIFLDAPSELIGVCHSIIAMGKAGWLAEDPTGTIQAQRHWREAHADTDPVRP